MRDAYVHVLVSGEEGVMAEISKDILEQYCAMKEEAKDLRERIDKGEKYLRKMQEKDTRYLIP